MTKLDWENITNYIDSVGTTDTVFPFVKVQSSVKVTASGARDNIIYTIGGQSGTLSPGQSVTITGTISSMTLRSASGRQPFQVWAVEAGTEKDETDTSYQGQIDGLTTQLAQKAQQTDLQVTNNTVALKADKTYVDNKLAGAVNTAPIPVSLAANMIDHTKNYVYTGTESGYTAGHWYGWNGSTWIDGGIYQSAGIANGSVKPSHLSFSVQTVNLFNKDDFIKGYAPNGAYQSGKVTDMVTNSLTWISPIYQVTPGDIYKFNYVFTKGTDYNIAFYDTSGLCVGSYSYALDTDGAYKITVPSGASQMRFFIYDICMRNDIMFVKGNTLPSSFVPYGFTLNYIIPTLQDGSVTEKKATFLQKTVNMFNKADFVKGYAPNGAYQSGKVTDMVVNSLTWISPIYQVASGDIYKINYPFTKGTDFNIAVYDSTGLCQGSVSYALDTDGAYKFTIPGGITQIRFFVYDTCMRDDLMLVKGNSLPTVFTPYGYIFNGGTVHIMKSDLAFNPNDISDKVKLSFPKTIDFITGRKAELFEYGMVDANIDDSLYIVGFNQSDNSKVQGHGRLLIDNTAYSTKTTLTKDILLFNNKFDVMGESFVTFNIVPPIANPTSAKNILCIGDSLMGSMNQALPVEFKRLLTSSDSDAYGLTNFNLVGRVNFSGVNYEAVGGYGWNNYVDNPSTLNPSYPNNYFWDSSISDINIQKYMQTYCGGANLDYVIVVLGINHYVNSGSGYSSDMTVITAKAKYFLDKVHAAYPNCKILLCAEQKTTPLVYKQNSSYWKGMNNFVCSISKTYESIALDPNYSSFVRFVEMKSKFDSANNMQYSQEPVNLKSSKTAMYCLDYVHPATEGYKQYADALLASFFAINQ